MKKKVISLAFISMLAISTQASEKIKIGVILNNSEQIDARLKELKDAEFYSCQLGYRSNMDITYANQLKKACKKNGVSVTTLVGVPGGGIWNFTEGPSTLGLVPEKGREAKIAELKQMIDFCQMADIPAIHSHFGFIPENPGAPEYKSFITVMKDLGEYAKNKNVLIYFETGQETPTTLIRAIQDIGTGNLFINCDLANLVMYGKANSLDAVKMFGPLIKEFHAKDGKYPTNPYELGREVPIPEGEVDFPNVIKELKKNGFDGSITIEYELSGSSMEYLVKTRKYLQNLLDNN